MKQAIVLSVILAFSILGFGLTHDTGSLTQYFPGWLGWGTAIIMSLWSLWLLTCLLYGRGK